MLSQHVVAGARRVRFATLVLAVVMLVGAAALHAFDERYGQPASSSLQLRAAGTHAGAALAEQPVVKRWLPHLLW